MFVIFMFLCTIMKEVYVKLFQLEIFLVYIYKTHVFECSHFPNTF